MTSSTNKGRMYEDKVFQYFKSLLEEDKLVSANKKYSKIFQHKKYSTNTSRKIEFDIIIENYNPLGSDITWSSLIVVECKNYKRKVECGDFDEFEGKIQKVSSSAVMGIMVSTAGFTDAVIEQAIKSHIALVVLSSFSDQWIVTRDVYKEPEKLIHRLLGNSAIESYPIVYFKGAFMNIVELLEKNDVVISDNNIINFPSLSDAKLKEIASAVYAESSKMTDEIASEILCMKFPEYRITFAEHNEGVLGEILLKDKIISLSNEIINDIHRRNFTLAHELGHLILHVPILNNHIDKIMDYGYDDKLVPVLPNVMFEKIEIQANKFAAYLLVPRRNLHMYFYKILKELNINKGTLYLDKQSCNIHDVNYTLLMLSKIFNVSKEVIKYRLINEELLVVENVQPQRIRDIIRNTYL